MFQYGGSQSGRPLDLAPVTAAWAGVPFIPHPLGTIRAAISQHVPNKGHGENTAQIIVAPLIHKKKCDFLDKASRMRIKDGHQRWRLQKRTLRGTHRGTGISFGNRGVVNRGAIDINYLPRANDNKNNDGVEQIGFYEILLRRKCLYAKT
ncbi:hypothetical protein J6590_081421 [Homalodisca vitripennis]|nr:hypothetical protein J6590_081421 [Homalodisca vitripennis]